MDTLREDRARGVQIDQLKCLLKGLREFDSMNGLCQRIYVQCSSGSRETTSSIAQLIRSGNVIVDKVLMAFTTLANEVDLLMHEARSRFYDCLLLYGEDYIGSDSSDSSDGEMVGMSRFLPFLFDLSQFIIRCYEILRCILSQLHGFFKLGTNVFDRAKERPLTRLWRCLGDVMSIFVVLDEIVGNHPLLTQHWASFSQAISVVQHNPIQFGAVDKRLRPLLEAITQIDLLVMKGNILQNACQQNFGEELMEDKLFLTEKFQKTIIEMLNGWDKLAAEDMPDKHKLLIIVSLSILHHHITKCMDKKLLAALCATHRRILSFHLIGDIMITPTELLFAQVPETKKSIDRKTIASIAQAKANLLEKQLEILSKEVQQMETTVAEWKSELSAFAVSTNEALAEPTIFNRCTCILKGARIADKINRLVKCVLNGYLCEDKKLPKSSAQQIFHLIELINSISLTFNFHWPSILEWCNHACALWSGNMLRVLEGIRQQMSIQDTKAVDIASALQIAEHSFCHAPTRLRLVICGMALDVANYKKFFRPLEAGEMDDFLTRLDSLSNIGLVLSRVTDCSFLCWHRSLFVLYFETLLEDSRPVENIELFLRSFRNCSMFFDSAKHCDPAALRKSFQQYVFSQFKEKFLDKLCNEIENDLRLSFHLHQDISIEKLEKQLFPPKKASKGGDAEANSTSTRPSVVERRLVSLLDLPEFRLGDQIIHIKRYVTTFLETAFYNLTVVALHDCETYSKMRLLAKTRYGLYLWADKLPYMSVDQGLDVLLVMRNIHVFATNYAYDLNEQLFVEKNSKNRSLNVMQMQQVVNSIKTHGNGILNSSCHFVYQFLKKKFQIFSQFLFDDQIKSQLIKEIKFYRDSIDELNQMYPVERAEYFNSRIKKIGASSDISFLDKFRELITQIGNAVGFVRMLRAGASESCSYAANFSSKGTDEKIFNELLQRQASSGQEIVGNESCDKHSVSSAEVLHSLNNNINATFDNTDDHVEIINVLINVFAREFRNHEKFSHLRNFFIIIPALTINFIEHICLCRSRLGKHRSQETDFTFVDDGFSMGTAYILKLLNQNYFFESLNWFESISLKYGAEADSYFEEQKNTQRQKDERNADMSLTMKINRIEENRREFQNLEHTFQSALIFFKVEEVEQETEETFLEEF